MNLSFVTAWRNLYSTLKVFIIVVAFSLVPKTSASQTADKLKIAYASPSVNVSILWITNEAKLFTKNGLDVEVLFLAPSLLQQAIISGDIQFGMMTGGLMSAPRFAGADLVMLAGFVNRYVSRVVVRPDINSPADLKGKRAGVSSFGTSADNRGFRLLLRRWGLVPDKDVTFRQFLGGGDGARIAALIANEIDTTLLNPPYHKKAVDGGMKVLANMEDMDINIQHIGLVTTQNLIKKNPDVVRRTVKSYVEAIHVMRTNPELTKQALRKYMKIADQAELEDTYQLLRKLLSTKPYPTMEGFKLVFEELTDKIPAARTADPKDFIDIRFLEELDRSGYIDQLYK